MRIFRMSAARTKVSPVAHIVHMVICVASMGFIFPDAFMENEEFKNFPDLTKKPK